MSLPEAIRLQNADVLEGFLHHDFFTAVQAGTLSPRARDAYFRYEHRFVQQAIVIMGHLLIKSPTREAGHHIGAILQGLVAEQLPTFERIFERIPSPSSPLPSGVSAFCEGMTTLVKDGTYAQGLSVLLAAEWSYGQISRRLIRAGVEDTLLHDWFHLHVQPGFTAGIAWIENELERTGHPEDPIADLSETFRRAVHLEIDFHTLPLKAG